MILTGRWFITTRHFNTVITSLFNASFILPWHLYRFPFSARSISFSHSLFFPNLHVLIACSQYHSISFLLPLRVPPLSLSHTYSLSWRTLPLECRRSRNTYGREDRIKYQPSIIRTRARIHFQASVHTGAVHVGATAPPTRGRRAIVARREKKTDESPVTARVSPESFSFRYNARRHALFCPTISVPIEGGLWHPWITRPLLVEDLARSLCLSLSALDTRLFMVASAEWCSKYISTLHASA